MPKILLTEYFRRGTAKGIVYFIGRAESSLCRSIRREWYECEIKNRRFICNKRRCSHYPVLVAVESCRIYTVWRIGFFNVHIIHVPGKQVMQEQLWRNAESENQQHEPRDKPYV